MLKLATGQQMATFLKNKGVNLTKLTSAQIRNGNNGADLSALTQAQRQALVKDTPLWFYILREAELNGGKLKGVGARIVAETFHGRWRAASTRSCATRPSRRAGSQQQHVPDGGSAAVRVRGEEGAAGAERLEVSPCDRGVGGRGACLRRRSRMRHAQRASIRNRRRHHPRVLRRLLERLRVRSCVLWVAGGGDGYVYAFVGEGPLE